MNPAMIKQFLNSNLAKPLDTLINEKTGLLQALLGAANPAVGDTTTAMNFLKLIYNQIGQDDPVAADRTNIMNYLKLLEESGGMSAVALAAMLDPTGIMRLYGIGTDDVTISGTTTWSGGINLYKDVTIPAGTVLTVQGGNTAIVLLCRKLTVAGTFTVSGKGHAGGAQVTRTGSAVYAGIGNNGSGSSSYAGASGGAGGGIDRVSGTGGAESAGGFGGASGTNPAVPGTLFAGDNGLTALYTDFFGLTVPRITSAVGLGGGGGGGGAVAQIDTTAGYTGVGGAGGAGGGAIVVIAGEIVVSSTGSLRADGINGSPGVTSNNIVGSGGGGGGGGCIALFAKNITQDGVITANGGAGGAKSSNYGSTYTSSAGGNGGAGFVKVRRLG